MYLDKIELGIAVAILRTHAELSDLKINEAMSAHLPDDITITDLEEDRDVLTDIADKMQRMISSAPACVD